MNNDQIKELLLKIQPCEVDFSVVLSGKQSKKVNGLYKPEEKEIVLHNKNFKNDNLLVYTAIHEYAHHLHFHSDDPPKSMRAHTRRFRNILHTLLNRAEELGLYRSVLESDPRLAELTEKIRSGFIVPHGGLMKKFGRVLMEAQTLCDETGVRFEDYISRILNLNQYEIRHIIRVSQSDLPEEIGYANMKTISGIRDPDKREEALKAVEAGFTQDMLREQLLEKDRDGTEADPMENLLKEKQKILRTIDTLSDRLKEIEKRMAEL